MTVWIRRLRRAFMCVGALVGTVVLVVATLGRTDSRITDPRMVLSSGTSFTITSTISSSATNQVPDLFYPGTPRWLWYTVHNPLHAAITVNALTVGIDPNLSPPPSTCPASNLDLSQANFAGTLTVAPGANGSVSRPISLRDTASSQNACRNVIFHFAYAGTATYTEVYATSTAVTASPSPSIVGQSVTYTATVTGAIGPSAPDPLPNSPTGTVTFKDGPSVICANVAVTSASGTTATAQCMPAAYMAAATHPITAVYSNFDLNFSGSTSPVFNQVVNPSATTTVLTSAPNPSTFGQAVTLTASVAPGSGPTPTGTVSFYAGTPAGSHSLLGTGTLNALAKATIVTSVLAPGSDSLYAVYGSSANDTGSTSPVIIQTVNFTAPCITGTVNGGYTVHTGQSICIIGRINGGTTVQSGGALYLNGATINGGLVSTGATGLRFCGSTLNGAVSITGSTGFMTIGDGADDGPPGCAGNTFNLTLSLTVSNNTRGLEFGANNVTGAVSFSGNTGAGPTPEDAVPEVEGNKITGTLSCATTNSPALTNGGQRNTVTGLKSGQCSAAGF